MVSTQQIKTHRPKDNRFFRIAYLTLRQFFRSI